MKVPTVLGSRPQFVKASAVSRTLQGFSGFDEVVVHTGQHFDKNLSAVFFAEPGVLAPAYNLGIHGSTHGEMTVQMLAGGERILLDEQPDAVLVYGDTNSTLAGVLAAVKLHIPVTPVEAGLPSLNMAILEEVNRILSDCISHGLFTPTDVACSHLARQGAALDQINTVGDVMLDVALHHGARVHAHGRALDKLGLSPVGYILATVHRAEDTDDSDRLAAIVDALEAIAARLPVVWPLHPRTRGVPQRTGRLDRLARGPLLLLIEPLGYLDMMQLEKHTAAIATNSGGVQKEAFFYEDEVPCATLRDETAWVELVDADWSRLAPPVSALALRDAALDAIGTRGAANKPYGAGDAAQRTVQWLCADHFSA